MREPLSNRDVARAIVAQADALDALAERAGSPAAATAIRATAVVLRRLAAGLDRI